MELKQKGNIYSPVVVDMTKGGFTYKAYRCRRCAYAWVPRKADPTMCPRCKRPDWDKVKVKKYVRTNPKKSDKPFWMRTHADVPKEKVRISNPVEVKDVRHAFRKYT